MVFSTKFRKDTSDMDKGNYMYDKHITDMWVKFFKHTLSQNVLCACQK